VRRKSDFDGLRMGGPSGEPMRVFAPRWWQAWRWISWWRIRRSGVARGTVEVHIANASWLGGGAGFAQETARLRVYADASGASPRVPIRRVR
jgi:hypothetical protein